MPLSFRIVGYQCLFVGVLAALLCLISVQQGLAALMAGVACILPNGYFAWSAERATNPHRLLGQSGAKILLTITLLAVVFSQFKPEALGFFLAFIGLQLVHTVSGLTSSNVSK